MVFNRLVMKRLAITFLVVMVSCAMLAAAVPGKIIGAQASTESVGPKENVSNVCEVRKEKEFPKKKRLNAQEWVQRGLEYLGSKNYEDAKRAFTNAIEINEGFLQLFNRATAMHIRYGNQKQANNYLEKIIRSSRISGSLITTEALPVGK